MGFPSNGVYSVARVKVIRFRWEIPRVTWKGNVICGSYFGANKSWEKGGQKSKEQEAKISLEEKGQRTEKGNPPQDYYRKGQRFRWLVRLSHH